MGNTSDLVSNKSDYFPALTGVRAIAAYMVFFHHFNPGNHFNPLGYIFAEFSVGVNFFFVLSGFLIAYRYFGNFKGFRQYYINRFARIYPMYFLLTTLYFILHHPNSIHNIEIFLANITFLRGFFDSLKFSMLAPGWSLTVEETFYFLAPVFFYFILTNSSFLIKLPVLIIAFGIVQVLIFKNFNLYGFMGSFRFMFLYTFWGRCIEFFVGIMLAIQFKKQRTIYRYVKNKTAMGLLIISIILGSIVIAKHSLRIPDSSLLIIGCWFLPLFGIGLFYNGLLVEKTLISKILSSKIFVLLGKSSYIFYLIHMDLFRFYFNYEKTHFGFPNFLVYLGGFVLVNIVSIILFRLVEDPLNKYLRRKLSVKKAVAEPKNVAEVIINQENIS